MPVITALEPQQRESERVNVFLDGVFAFGASRMVIAAHRLSTGSQLSDAEIDDLLHDEALERAYSASLNFLSYRPRSRGEMQRYFRRRKIEPQVADAVLERLQRSGLVDDGEFARFWVDNRLRFRPKGSRALRVELRQKGVDAEVIDAALDAVGDEERLAYEAGGRKVNAFERLDDREFFQKMVAFLCRRGFPYAAASVATRRLAAERGREEPEELQIAE